MVGLDSSTPPVIFVVGTAGAGKSSLVTAFQRWSRFLETDAIAVNLDPGAERVHYDAEFDVRDLISLTEVMTEYDLGPNGAQILDSCQIPPNSETEWIKTFFIENYGTPGFILFPES